MSKKLNHLEKILKFHCSTCQTTWQLLVIRNGLKTQCLNNCLAKWEEILVNYCQEQIILALVKKEQQKDEKSKELADWLERIKKNQK